MHNIRKLPKIYIEDQRSVIYANRERQRQTNASAQYNMTLMNIFNENFVAACVVLTTVWKQLIKIDTVNFSIMHFFADAVTITRTNYSGVEE